MFNSDHSSSGTAPEKPASATPLYLLAVLIGAVAVFAFFLIFGSHSKKTGLVKPAAIVQPAIAPAAVVAEPEPVSEEPAAIEAEVEEPAPVEAEVEEPAPVEVEVTAPEDEPLPIEPEPEPVDNAIIPADHNGPPWALNLMSLSDPDGSPEHVDQITALGYTPEVVEVNIDGQHWLRLRIKGFATITAARKAGQHFVANKDYRTLWIGGY